MSRKEWLNSHLQLMIAEGNLVQLKEVVSKLVDIVDEKLIEEEFQQERIAKPEWDKGEINARIAENEIYIREYQTDPEYDVTEAIEENLELRQQLHSLGIFVS